MYADDMAIWATQECTGTAQARLQLALDALRMWTGTWLMKINHNFHIIKFQTVRLKIGEHQLREESSPTYLENKKYPINEWIRIYTDGSATDAGRNGGGGVYATLPDGTTLERSFACAMMCTNYTYRAEAEAIKEALNMVNNKISKTSKVVILRDARSVLQTLENTKDTELDTVRKKTAGVEGQGRRTHSSVDTRTQQHRGQ
ncbi:reverse transcriptase [Elysia marginata]|uniref:Reverse transcriptase n=1 Tax=Elysia marginata TaxID=1093978 RepID=A0AAV4IE26_9GAST|nr:reverse transcriptase [Elysia marginata]